mmetsp:Transcript_28647/g.48356  ORF Transcript_28647/g.48356 Transcript_28647/m.48356 type:complete len:345 (-) Transcript_28647:343-1377(-)
MDKLSLDDDFDDDHSDYDDSEMKCADEKICWLGDEEEKKMEMETDQEDEIGDENRPLFNPASLVRKSFAYKSLSHVPYPKEETSDTDMMFWTLQVKPKTINPDIVQMFYCLSSIVQTQIKEDENSQSEFTPYPEFDVPLPSLGTSMGGDFASISEIPPSLMEREDEVTKPYILEGRVPMFFTVFRFMIHLHEQIKYDRECNIMALVYLNRITTANNMALTNQNWRLLWLLAVMVAQKVWAHKPVRSGGFCRFYVDLRKSILKRSELAMMAMLDYNTGVPPSLYAKYYLELNELFKGLMDTLHVGNGRDVWDWEPVSDFTKALLKRKCQQAAVDREAFSSKRVKK